MYIKTRKNHLFSQLLPLRRNSGQKDNSVRRINNERGLGLVELLISILIMTGVVAALFAAYASLPEISNMDKVKLELQAESRAVLEEISQAIQETNLDSGDWSVTDSNPDLITTTDCSGCAGSCEGCINTLKTYSVASGVLIKTNAVGATEKLIGDYDFGQFYTQVSSFDVVDNWPTTNTVSITLTVDILQDVVGEGTRTVETLTFTTQAYPRNNRP